jgi:8-oxo-dGTP diphosphatase
VPANPKIDRPRLLVVAALITRRGRVLLSQRRPTQSFPLTWEFPGGKVEAGESPVAALERELREELGCGVRVGPIVEAVFHSYPDFDLVMLVYRTTIVSGTPHAVDVQAVAWVSRGGLKDLVMPPADLPLAKKLSALTGAIRPRRGTRRMLVTRPHSRRGRELGV